ncbi:hypothetical protein [Pseudomonas purpurea]|uniref:hypothetical protein n=1 Tax=Pseudomonas purpurea TaxID=3136737 RepID=UPI003264642A
MLMIKVGLLLLQITGMLIFVGKIALYRNAFKWFRRSEPLRCATVEQQRLLARYYPKETFDRNVHRLSGSYRRGGTMREWQGMDLIGDLPVMLPPLAKPFLKEHGENTLDVVCGKEHAYVIRLNEGYDIERYAQQVEDNERHWAQWDFGVPGPRINGQNIEILGQRRSRKTERRIDVYVLYSDVPDTRRLLGSLAVVLGMLLFWMMATNWIEDKGWFVLGTLVALLGFLPITLEKHHRPEPINRLRGIYSQDPELTYPVLIGDEQVWGLQPYRQLMAEHLQAGQEVTLEATVKDRRIVRIDGLPDPYIDWDYRQYEPLIGNVLMLTVMLASLALGLYHYPSMERTPAQAWVIYSSAGLCVAYAVNLLRRLWQRRHRMQPQED